jgi:serine/threonine protein kinase
MKHISFSIKDYIIIEQLGEDGFGITFDAVHNHNDLHYCVKSVPLRSVSKEDLVNVRTEVRILASLKHSNNDEYKTSFLDNKKRFANKHTRACKINRVIFKKKDALNQCNFLASVAYAINNA